MNRVARSYVFMALGPFIPNQLKLIRFVTLLIFLKSQVVTKQTYHWNFMTL